MEGRYLGNKTYIETLDTTLRDGAQSVDVSFTPSDKIKIALALDELGVDYIEGGWPGSNPKDKAFFDEIKEYTLKNAKIAAFGSTLHKDKTADKDSNLNEIINSGVDVAVIFGKSWLLHVDNVLKVPKEKNLELISTSVSYLKSHGLKVIFDAEHFYQGFLDSRDYALSVLKTAKEAGSEVLVLADTNGGTPPNKVYEITKEVSGSIAAKLGVHMHNDIGCAVSNSILGVAAGATHVQGTINGIGERTGNADLLQIIPTLSMKLGYDLINSNSLGNLKHISSLVYELSGITPDPCQPFVGSNAFAHKGGIHSDAVLKDTRAYEHMDPDVVGNKRVIIISELSGASSLVAYAKDLGIELEKSDNRVREALASIKELEREGYSFDLAPESALLILLEKIGLYKNYINLSYWKVISERGINIAVVKTGSIVEVSEGVGPVNAVDLALRRAFERVYPQISRISLTDYRVILPKDVKNTESIVRVTVEFSDNSSRWRTMGVSRNIFDASIKALIDGLNFYLWKNKTAHR